MEAAAAVVEATVAEATVAGAELDSAAEEPGEEEDDKSIGTPSAPAYCCCVYCGKAHPENPRYGEDYGEDTDDWGWDVERYQPAQRALVHRHRLHIQYARISESAHLQAAQAMANASGVDMEHGAGWVVQSGR